MACRRNGTVPRPSGAAGSGGGGGGDGGGDGTPSTPRDALKNSQKRAHMDVALEVGSYWKAAGAVLNL